MSGPLLGRPRLRFSFPLCGFGERLGGSRSALALGDRLDARSRRRFSLGFYCSFLRSLRCRLPLAETAAKLQRNLIVQGTGVRLLVRDSELRQQLEENVRLYFELASQLIDANFTHTVTPRRILLLRPALKPGF